MDTYIPIDCGFHDEIESLITLRQECWIIYHNAAGEVVERHDRIIDVYTADKAEYLKLTDNTEIRLDQLVSVNGKLLSSSSD